MLHVVIEQTESEVQKVSFAFSADLLSPSSGPDQEGWEHVASLPVKLPNSAVTVPNISLGTGVLRRVLPGRMSKMLSPSRIIRTYSSTVVAL